MKLNYFLQTLSASRSQDAEVLNKPEYAGIMKLVTDLYPDTAHFIFELLQNSEDVKATKIIFRLTLEQLEVEHNGLRSFEKQDIESITSIGNSTKSDDETSIGKFGIGFKSVFSYTNTPFIYSDECSFKIRDLIVPEPIEPLPKRTSNTIFRFPFNNPKKPPAIAAKEIELGLRGLGDNCLLFLSHIQKIEYSLPDGSVGSLNRINLEKGRVDIRSQYTNENDTFSHWLHFDKEVEVIDGNKQSKFCRIAIAYSLSEFINEKTSKSIWKIVPLDRGEVSIYFPAEKETSNLRFHLHAPFASTVARDSVRDCIENHTLRDQISTLVVESLSAIRDQGLLTVDFLAVLPNLSDNLGDSARFYEPIRRAIIKGFQKDNLTPMKRGGHAAAQGIFKGPAIISDLINDDDLVQLLDSNYETPMWVANPPQRNQREDRFLESLDIKEWGWRDLANLINHCNWGGDQELILKLISDKDDAWLMKFYALLGEAEDVHDQHLYVSEIPMIRTMKDGNDKHVTPSEAYFAPEDPTSLPQDVLFVKSSLYLSGRSESQKKFAKSFLESADVQPYDLKASIQLMLNGYTNNDADEVKINANYYSDLKQMITYWKNNPADIALYTGEDFLLGIVSETGGLCWSSCEELCLDKPYIESGLADLISIHKKKVLWAGYQDKFNKTEFKDFVKFLIAIGVMTELIVGWAKLSHNPKWISRDFYKDSGNARNSNAYLSYDYSIDHLESYLHSQSVSSSLLIWNALINADQKVAKARYRPNAQYSIKEYDSQLIHHLKNYAWIPNKVDKFCKPQDMSKDDLRDDFPFNNRNGLLTSIEFGENARKKSEEYQTKNSKAQEIGFESTEEAELAQKVMEKLKQLKITPAEFIANKRQVEQPVESVPNPERRREHVLELAESALSKDRVIRERSIQPGINTFKAEAKAYLRAKYTNANNEMICQCCQNEMPFKIKDAYYFEAVPCIKETKDLHTKNNLALCPLCAAKYQYARETNDTEILSLIVNHDAFDKVPAIEIAVKLAGSNHKLRFVGTHWFDLKELLKNINNSTK